MTREEKLKMYYFIKHTFASIVQRLTVSKPDTHDYSCICDNINEYCRVHYPEIDLRGDGQYSLEIFETHFPEFIKHRPRSKDAYHLWFNLKLSGHKKRLALLETIITELETKL